MKGYCFIDMHIHSMFSNEEGVSQTPKKILDTTVELIEEYKAKTQPTIVKLRYIFIFWKIFATNF